MDKEVLLVERIVDDVIVRRVEESEKNKRVKVLLVCLDVVVRGRTKEATEGKKNDDDVV